MGKRRDSSQYTVRSISEALGKLDTPFLYGSFLDAFYHETDEVRQMMISEEPFFSEQFQLFLCEMAAAVEYLSVQFHLKTPSWVYKEQYYLNQPYYALNTKNKEYQDFLKRTSFDEYRKRNLFLGDSVVQRV